MRRIAKYLIIIIAILFFTVFSATVLANPAHDLIMKMSDEDRNIAFLIVLRNSDQTCEVIVRNFFQGLDINNNSFWSVACRNKNTFMVMINNDAKGTTRAADCSAMKLIANVECFTKLK